MTPIPLWWYLIVAAALFCIGLYGTLARRNALNVLMGVELMLNAVSLQTVAFWRHTSPVVTLDVFGTQGQYVTGVSGQAFSLFIITLAAAEAAVGLALIIAIYRNRGSVELDLFDALRG
jgi:NADH-quinone oxidoreductase subunit K